MLADFYDLKTSHFMFKSCCDGHFLQRACCPSAVWVLGVVLYDKPAQKSTKKQAHTLHSSSSWILFWFQSNTLILNRDPRTPLSFLYTRHWRLFPSNVSWDVLSPWAVPSCKHKSPGKERCDGETNEKGKFSQHKPAGQSADTSQPPQSALHYRIHNHNGSLPLRVNNNRGGL